MLNLVIVIVNLNNTIVPNDYTATLSSRTFVDSAICNFSHYVFMNNVFTVFKYLHSPRVDDFTNFVLLSSVSERESRASQSNKLTVPCTHRKSDDLYFWHTGVCAWNSLPNIITQCNSFNVFKNSAIKHLIKLMS